MTQSTIEQILEQAHTQTASSLVAINIVDAIYYINELETTFNDLLVAYAARCKEVFNLRVALRMELPTERLDFLEEFTINDPFYLQAVTLTANS